MQHQDNSNASYLQGDDLIKLMKTLEGWAHRLMPKLTFDDVIEKSEKLGSKKNMQVCSANRNLAHLHQINAFA